MREMHKKERVDAAVRGEGVDRPPVALWRHFYDSEETAVGLAEAMVRWQKEYDWDWLKINPRASYHVEGWGVTLRFSGQPLDKPVVLSYPLQSAADLGRLQPLPLDGGPLAEQLQAISLIRDGIGPSVYAIETVFSPLSILGDMIDGHDTLRALLVSSPQAVHDALAVITETFRGFSRACVAAGADGLFFATTHWASFDLLTAEQYAEFGRPYDLQVLAAVQDAPFNVLHVCKNHNMLESLVDYPVHAINWAVGSPGNATLAAARAYTGRCLVGGLRNETLRGGRPGAVAAEAAAAYSVTHGRGWMLGPACSAPVDAPEANIRAARAAVERMPA